MFAHENSCFQKKNWSTPFPGIYSADREFWLMTLIQNRPKSIVFSENMHSIPVLARRLFSAACLSQTPSCAGAAGMVCPCQQQSYPGAVTNRQLHCLNRAAADCMGITSAPGPRVSKPFAQGNRRTVTYQVLIISAGMPVSVMVHNEASETSNYSFSAPCHVRQTGQTSVVQN